MSDRSVGQGGEVDVGLMCHSTGRRAASAASPPGIAVGCWRQLHEFGIRARSLIERHLKGGLGCTAQLAIADPSSVISSRRRAANRFVQPRLGVSPDAIQTADNDGSTRRGWLPWIRKCDTASRENACRVGDLLQRRCNRWRRFTPPPLQGSRPGGPESSAFPPGARQQGIGFSHGSLCASPLTKSLLRLPDCSRQTAC